MMKRLRTALCLLLAATVIGAVPAARSFSARAETPPSVTPSEQTEFVKEAGQTEFDAKTLFTVDYGSYDPSQISAAYTVTKDGLPVSHTDLVIPFEPGAYKLNVLLTGNGVSIGAPVTAAIDFTLKAEAPSIVLKAVDGVQTINVQKNQAFIDLTLLYDVEGNSFSGDEWTVQYDVKYPGRTVDLFGDYIKSISGVYTVVVSVASKDGSFETVDSTMVTMIVQKTRPSVVFEYETESGMASISGEHTTYVYAGTQYIDLNDFFTVYGNAYVANEYAASLIVKRKESDGSFTNCQTFDGMIAPTEGEYHVTVKVNPQIQGAFTPVTSDELILHVEKALPSVNVSADEYVYEYDASGKIVSMNRLVSIGNSAFNASQYTVSYAFESGKDSFTTTDPLVKLKNGDWNVTVTVTANNGEFDPQSATFTLHVDVPMSTGVLLTIILVPCGVVLIGGAVAAILLVRRAKKKKQA